MSNKHALERTEKYFRRESGSGKGVAWFKIIMNIILKEINEQVQWSCNEYENYPNAKIEQKKYHSGLSLILIAFSNEMILWKKRVKELPEREQTLLLDYLAKLGKSFKLVAKTIRVAKLQAILGDVKSYSAWSCTELTINNSTLLNLKNQSLSPVCQHDTVHRARTYDRLIRNPASK